MFVSPSSAWLSASVLAPGAGAYLSYLQQHGYAFFVRPINEVLCSADVPAGSDLCVAGLASLLSKTFK